MKTKLYSVSGTIEIPNNVDIYEVLSEMTNVKGPIFIDLDQVDDISEDEED